MKDPHLLMLIALVPAILLAIYIYKKDKVEKEPGRLLFKLVFGGFLSVVIALILELLYGAVFPGDPYTYTGLFIHSFCGIAIFEEGAKYLMTYAFTWNSKEFKHVFDGIVYSVFVGLSFAAIENIIYVFESGWVTGLIRGITAVPGHFFFAIFMGANYGLCKQASILNNKKAKAKYAKAAFFAPVLIHTLYDFFVLGAERATIFFFILYISFLIFLYIISFKKVKVISNVENNFVHDDDKVELKEKYCMNCGTKFEGDYCATCGVKRE